MRRFDHHVTGEDLEGSHVSPGRSGLTLMYTVGQHRDSFSLQEGRRSANYRPISNLTTVSKVIERLVGNKQVPTSPALVKELRTPAAGVSASTLYRNGSIVWCTRAMSMAVYGPCTRVHNRVHGRINVYTARTQSCTAVRRPCTCAVNTAEYTRDACTRPRSCTGREHGRARAVYTTVCTRSCTSRVHRRLCTRTVSIAVYTARPCTRVCARPRTRTVHDCVRSVYAEQQLNN